MDEYSTRIPSVFSSYGHSCYHCAKGTKDAPLQRCSSCSRVYYCGPDCQKANWPKHRPVCKALKTLETKHSEELRQPFRLLAAFSGQGLGNPELVNDCINGVSAVEARVIQEELKRGLEVEERNLIGWQPRCLACGRSNLLLRIEASSASSSPKTAYKQLHACEDCQMSFFCSPAHWDLVQSMHQDIPCADGINGHSQCVMNAHALQDLRFSQFMAGAEAGPFKWAPERTKDAWESLRGVDWKDFTESLKTEFGHSADIMMQPMLRAVTEGLSMPMTILWALENLNADDAWTKKDSLTIHILGAADMEITNANLFEELLHRVPSVKTVNLVLCGPELLDITGPRSGRVDMETCPQCSVQGRKRIQEYHPWTYHDYIKRQGSKYAPPDLAIAFNSGCSQEAPWLWKDTIAVLADRHIPTVFTAYNEEESQAESRLLTSAGAVLHPELGPRRNPWGSLQPKTEPNKITGYYMVNGWLAGGFR